MTSFSNKGPFFLFHFPFQRYKCFSVNWEPEYGVPQGCVLTSCCFIFTFDRICLATSFPTTMLIIMFYADDTPSTFTLTHLAASYRWYFDLKLPKFAHFKGGEVIVSAKKLHVNDLHHCCNE